MRRPTLSSARPYRRGPAVYAAARLPLGRSWPERFADRRGVPGHVKCPRRDVSRRAGSMCRSRRAVPFRQRPFVRASSSRHGRPADFFASTTNLQYHLWSPARGAAWMAFKLVTRGGPAPAGDAVREYSPCWSPTGLHNGAHLLKNLFKLRVWPPDTGPTTPRATSDPLHYPTWPAQPSRCAQRCRGNRCMPSAERFQRYRRTTECRCTRGKASPGAPGRPFSSARKLHQVPPSFASAARWPSLPASRRSLSNKPG